MSNIDYVCNIIYVSFYIFYNNARVIPRKRKEACASPAESSDKIDQKRRKPCDDQKPLHLTNSSMVSQSTTDSSYEFPSTIRQFTGSEGYGLLPCRHFVQSLAPSSKFCPVCKTAITVKYKVFVQT